jgi:hypothetical protein
MSRLQPQPNRRASNQGAAYSAPIVSCAGNAPAPEGAWRRNQAKRLKVYCALPHGLAEPALSDDIAAVLLPPQHDFDLADRERQIESSDGMLSSKPAGRTRRNREQEIRGRDNLRQHAEMGHAQRDLAGATEFLQSLLDHAVAGSWIDQEVSFGQILRHRQPRREPGMPTAGEADIVVGEYHFPGRVTGTEPRLQTAASILPAVSHSSSLVTSMATISNPSSGMFWSAAMR